VPNGTPPDVIAKLNSEIAKVMQSAETKKLLSRRVSKHGPARPSNSARSSRANPRKWGKVIADANIKE
jgi:tripartite-type tricarboxylate transporter receptor subunit TctC